MIYLTALTGFDEIEDRIAGGKAVARSWEAMRLGRFKE
jgi:hypothetical protein